MVHMGVSGERGPIVMPTSGELNFFVATDIPTPQHLNCSNSRSAFGGPTAAISDNITRQELPCFARESIDPGTTVAVGGGGGAQVGPLALNFQYPNNIACLVSTYPLPKITMKLCVTGGVMARTPNVLSNAEVDWTFTFQIQLLD